MVAVSLLATEASFPEWIRPGSRFDGIRSTLRCNFDVMVELGLVESLTVPLAVVLIKFCTAAAPPTLFSPPTLLPLPFHIFLPPFPLPLPEAAVG